MRLTKQILQKCYRSIGNRLLFNRNLHKLDTNPTVGKALSQFYKLQLVGAGWRVNYYYNYLHFEKWHFLSENVIEKVYKMTQR